MIKKSLIIFCISSTVVAAPTEKTEEVTELEELTVYAPANKVSTPTPENHVLSGDALRNKIAGTIGETLKNELGITSQSFGAGVGAPVIRGQSGSRVKVMQNGIGNNDVSNLSPDHANSVEPLLAERVEILRGANSLAYGSGMMGGVIQVIDNRIPEQLPDKLFGGAAEQRFDSANHQTASVLKWEGGLKNLAYHLDGFYRSYGNLRIGGQAIDEQAARATDPTLQDVVELENSRGIIKQTGGWSRGGSAGMSYIAEQGFVGAAINRLINQYGIPADGSGGLPVTVHLKQTKYDAKAQLNQPFTGAKSVRDQFGYTDYQHTELDNGLPATKFLNETFENRLELEQESFAGLTGKIGFQSTHSRFAALGDEAIVPRAKQANYALFLLENLAIGDVKYEFGGRGEVQTIDAEHGEHLSFIPLSGSVSAQWTINPQHQLRLGLTHTQRAPGLQESLSNGIHAATRSYEVGNFALGKEYANNLDLSYHYQGQWLAAEINLFHNWVNDYIYQQRSGEVFNSALSEIEKTCSTDSSACLPVENMQQRNAIFRGFETKLVAPLLDNAQGKVDLTLFSDYTRGYFTQGGNVPRMPPLRYGFQLDYAYHGFSSNVRLTRAEAQNYVPEQDSATKGYVALNLGVNYALKNFHGSNLLVFAQGKNLLNENIRNATSYLRNFAPEAGRSAEIGIRVSY